MIMCKKCHKKSSTDVNAKLQYVCEDCKKDNPFRLEDALFVGVPITAICMMIIGAILYLLTFTVVGSWMGIIGLAVISLFVLISLLSAFEDHQYSGWLYKNERQKLLKRLMEDE